LGGEGGVALKIALYQAHPGAPAPQLPLTTSVSC